MVRELNDRVPRVPVQLTTAKRNEIDNAEMDIIGKLPDDLQGYVFIVAPVGNVDTEGLPYKDGNTF